MNDFFKPIADNDFIVPLFSDFIYIPYMFIA